CARGSLRISARRADRLDDVVGDGGSAVRVQRGPDGAAELAEQLEVLARVGAAEFLDLLRDANAGTAELRDVVEAEAGGGLLHVADQQVESLDMALDRARALRPVLLR